LRAPRGPTKGGPQGGRAKGGGSGLKLGQGRQVGALIPNPAVEGRQGPGKGGPAGFVLGQGRLECGLALHQQALAEDVPGAAQGLDLDGALLRALAEQAAGGFHFGALAAAVVLVFGHGALLLVTAIDGQGDAQAHLPHGIEAAPGHDARRDGEIRPPVQPGQVQQLFGLPHAGPRAGQFGAADFHGLGRQE